MATGGRKTHLPVIHQISRTFTPADVVALAAGALVGVLPAGAQLLRIHQMTSTAWNNGTSGTVSVGVTGAAAQYQAATSVQAQAFTTAAAPVAVAVPAADVPVLATSAFVGGAPTAGVTTVILEYLAAAG